MPKRAQEMTAKAVAALNADGRYAVGGVAGLYFRIEGQSRSWVLRIVVNGDRRDLGLGPYPVVSLAMARQQALKRRVALMERMPAAEGDPLPSHRPRPAQTTIDGRDKLDRSFEACAHAYIDAQAPGWKSSKHAKQWLSTLQSYAFPHIGKLDVSVIAASHITTILKPIWESKTETATRVRGRIESILDWAKHKNYREGENPARWEGNLRHE